MKTKLAVLALVGLVSAPGAFAQRDFDAQENDRRYCASGRSGYDFNTCLRQMQIDRNRAERNDRGDRYERDDRREYDRRQQWGGPPPPPPTYRQPVEPPRLSDMQERALNNCNLLQPRDQPRCRATVMSTVR
ncbi:MAG: hypothetical protein EOO24_23825 [Comamonadaceae bacterium]|nr:MAG: hypothetical protein EOO24_23825 [Comamonadaceae bacterium]